VLGDLPVDDDLVVQGRCRNHQYYIQDGSFHKRLGFNDGNN
jgi:hypothetical protein